MAYLRPLVTLTVLLALAVPAAAQGTLNNRARAALALSTLSRPMVAQAPQAPQAPPMPYAVDVPPPAPVQPMVPAKPRTTCPCTGKGDCVCAPGACECPACVAKAKPAAAPKAVKNCPCSGQCTCGCVVTGVCRCGNVPTAQAAVPSYYPSALHTPLAPVCTPGYTAPAYYPTRSFAPSFSGGGFSGGGRGGC